MSDKVKAESAKKKFYFRGIIWDKDANKALCAADDGVYETEDKEIISKLEGMGIPSKAEKKAPTVNPESKRRKKPPVVMPKEVILNVPIMKGKK